MDAHLLKLLVCLFVALQTQLLEAQTSVNITFIRSSAAKGAVCLDGSPAAYYYLQGSGNGAFNWIVYLRGGGWCTSKQDCYIRSIGSDGSSILYSSQNPRFTFSSTGILDDNKIFNPDFSDWHKVFVVYCDGSSFMSDIEKIDPINATYYRGARIYDAVMEDLLLKGMGSAQNAILAGGSAGGLATILHCDKFGALFPNTTRVKCISDSGFFIRAKDQPGVESREQTFANVVATHDLAHSLPTSCTSKMNPEMCLFPEYLVGDIQKPIFLIESAFDLYQVGSLTAALGGDDCRKNLTLCNSTQLEILKDFRGAFIETLQKLEPSSSRGMFVHTCYLHTHILGREEWRCSSVVGNVLANKTIGQAVGDWFYDRSNFSVIDTQNEFPRYCNNNFSAPEFNQKCLAVLPHNGSRPFL